MAARVIAIISAIALAYGHLPHSMNPNASAMADIMAITRAAILATKASGETEKLRLERRRKKYFLWCFFKKLRPIQLPAGP
uniref:U53-Eretoxin-Ek1b_1 n=1 Tax=Eresus cinnaberinus TaxID=175337 RepID=A0A2D0PCZ7_ERECI